MKKRNEKSQRFNFFKINKKAAAAAAAAAAAVGAVGAAAAGAGAGNLTDMKNRRGISRKEGRRNWSWGKSLEHEKMDQSQRLHLAPFYPTLPTPFTFTFKVEIPSGLADPQRLLATERRRRQQTGTDRGADRTPSNLRSFLIMDLVLQLVNGDTTTL